MRAFENDDRAIEAWLFKSAKSTQVLYRSDIGQLQQYLKMPLAAVRLTDLQGFQRQLERAKYRGKPLAPATIRRKLDIIKSLFGFLLKHSYIVSNPAGTLVAPKGRANLAGRILSAEEVQQLFTAAKSERDRLFLRFLYYSAARISEAIGLTWDKSFTQRPDGKTQVEIHGKGDKVRSVTIPAEFWEELQALRGDKARVFPFTRQTGDAIVKSATARAGLEKVVSCHWFRHAHASHSLRNGAPLQVVRDTLGHSSVMTTDRYLSAFPGESSSDYLS
jgi:integrase/recombinase XerD